MWGRQNAVWPLMSSDAIIIPGISLYPEYHTLVVCFVDKIVQPVWIPEVLCSFLLKSSACFWNVLAVEFVLNCSFACGMPIYVRLLAFPKSAYNTCENWKHQFCNFCHIIICFPFPSVTGMYQLFSFPVPPFSMPANNAERGAHFARVMT